LEDEGIAFIPCYGGGVSLLVKKKISVIIFSLPIFGRETREDVTHIIIKDDVGYTAPVSCAAGRGLYQQAYWTYRCGIPSWFEPENER
jgi:hypothetical protein